MRPPLPSSAPRTGHEIPVEGKQFRDRASSPKFPKALLMAELAKEIIRQQWPLRHHADPLRRAQARTLIRTHILLLRTWRGAPMVAR